MPQGTCGVIEDGKICGEPIRARGYCQVHYSRWRRHGDPGRVDKPGVPAKPRPVCSISDPDCPDPVNSHGLCARHDAARRRHGDPLTPSTVIEDMEERFFSHVRKEPDGCWTWTGAIVPDGYGQFGDGAGSVLGAHRWAYLHFVGALPDGKPELDHLCHTRERDTCPGGRTCLHRRCVNPDHLEPVTHQVNSERGVHRIKYPAEYVAELHARWKGGERMAVLAAEAGANQTYLYKRFRRLDAA